MSCLTKVMHDSRIFFAPTVRIASLSGVLTGFSSSSRTVISRSSYVSSLRSGIVTWPDASHFTLPSASHSWPSHLSLISSSYSGNFFCLRDWTVTSPVHFSSFVVLHQPELLPSSIATMPAGNSSAALDHSVGWSPTNASYCNSCRRQP